MLKLSRVVQVLRAKLNQIDWYKLFCGPRPPKGFEGYQYGGNYVWYHKSGAVKVDIGRWLKESPDAKRILANVAKIRLHQQGKIKTTGTCQEDW